MIQEKQMELSRELKRELKQLKIDKRNEFLLAVAGFAGLLFLGYGICIICYLFGGV